MPRDSEAPKKTFFFSTLESNPAQSDYCKKYKDVICDIRRKKESTTAAIGETDV